MLKQAVWFALILSQCLAAAQNHLRGGLIPSRPEDHSPSVIPAAIPHLQCVSTGYVGNRVNLVVGPDGVFRLNRKLLMSGPITTQARNLYAWGQVRVVEDDGRKLHLEFYNIPRNDDGGGRSRELIVDRRTGQAELIEKDGRRVTRMKCSFP